MAEITEDRAAQAGSDTKPFWVFTKGDWRNLYIGVVGSLVTVVIVAIALIVNRALGGIELTALRYLEISGAFAALGVLSWAANKLRVKVLGPLLVLLFFAVFAVGVLFALLLVIGEAAGIH